MNNPNHLFYTKEHEWADIKDNEIVIGITDYAQGQLGDVIFIEFPEVGLEMNIGDVFGEVEAVKTVSELYAPISGTISEVNDKLEDSPDLVNNDPYGDGWLIKVAPNNPDERDGLMNYIAYEEFIG
jgi:glycine cleavage system H protein|tara:strand:+ start:1774 stop:2151 length:378 start_codon:yes stop_codon:yes gene_type:complete